MWKMYSIIGCSREWMKYLYIYAVNKNDYKYGKLAGLYFLKGITL